MKKREVRRYVCYGQLKKIETNNVKQQRNMKRILNFVFALILMTSCQAQKEKLELNLTKGETYTQKMISNMSVIQDINGQKVNINMSISGKMTYKVTDIQNSIYDLEVRYESLSMRMSLPNGVIEFSSEKIDEKDIFSSLLGIMKDKPFFVKMTKTGKVNEVKNIEALFSNMFEKFPLLTEAEKQQFQSQLMQAYGEKAFKGNLEMCSAIFPDSLVSKGDKWIIITKLESGMAANMETTYELKEVNDSDFLLSGTSKIETADKDAYIQTNGMPLKYDMSGTMSSEIKINKKSGWVIESKIKQTIKGTTQIKDNPQMPGGMTIPMTMVNQMTITEK